MVFKSHNKNAPLSELQLNLIRILLTFSERSLERLLEENSVYFVGAAAF